MHIRVTEYRIFYIGLFREDTFSSNTNKKQSFAEQCKVLEIFVVLLCTSDKKMLRVWHFMHYGNDVTHRLEIIEQLSSVWNNSSRLANTDTSLTGLINWQHSVYLCY